MIKQADNVYIVLIGTKNQSEVHFAMPVKNALYDALNYGSQVKEAAKKHKDAGERGSGAEFLSGFHKEDRLKPFVPDYQINLIVPGEIEHFDKFRTELGSVLEIIKASADRDLMNGLF